jgi:hypothetical protein
MTLSRGRHAPLALVALLAVVGLTACTGVGAEQLDAHTPGEGATQGSGGDAGAGTSAFPGLYLDADVAIVGESETRLTVATTRSCPELSGMLAAGQWRLVDRLSFGGLDAEAIAMLAGFGGVEGALLQRGDALAFAAFDGGAACTATIATVAEGDLTLAGGELPGATSGWVAATRCYASRSDGDLTVMVYFDTDAGIGGQGEFTLSGSADGYVVGAADDSPVDLNLLRHGDRFLRAMTAAYATQSEPPLIALEAGETFTGTVTIDPAADAASPSGTVAFRGLVDDSWETEYAVTLPFACPGTIEMS